jgi:hypothetical protein
MMRRVGLRACHKNKNLICISLVLLLLRIVISYKQSDSILLSATELLRGVGTSISSWPFQASRKPQLVNWRYWQTLFEMLMPLNFRRGSWRRTMRKQRNSSNTPRCAVFWLHDSVHPRWAGLGEMYVNSSLYKFIIHESLKVTVSSTVYLYALDYASAVVCTKKWIWSTLPHSLQASAFMFSNFSWIKCKSADVKLYFRFMEKCTHITRKLSYLTAVLMKQGCWHHS